MLATFAWTQVLGGDGDRAPHDRAGRPGGGVEDVVHDLVATPPAADGRARGGKPAAGERDHRPVRGRVVIAERDRPTPGRRRSAYGDVAAKAEHDARPRRRGRGGGATIGSERFRGCPQVEPDAVRHEHGSGGAVQHDAAPVRTRRPPVGQRRPVGRDFGQIAVVPDTLQRGADGRIDRPASGARGLDRNLERLEQQRADADAPPGGRVERHQLRIVAEARAGGVDRSQLGPHRLDSGLEAMRLGGRDRCRGSERSPSRRERPRHEPPLETTGGAAVTGGGGVGAGCGTAAG